MKMILGLIFACSFAGLHAQEEAQTPSTMHDSEVHFLDDATTTSSGIDKELEVGFSPLEILAAQPEQCMPSTTEEQASEEESWGYHLILDCKACDIPTISSYEQLDKFTRELVSAIGMKAYGDPLLKHFAEHNPEAAGYSLLQFIETSSITGHFVEKNGDAYLDIFSCKPYEVETALKVVQEHLNPKNIKKTYLIRKA